MISTAENITLDRCVFVGNHVQDDGGIVFDGAGGTLSLMNCTFAANRADRGYVLLSYSSLISVWNSIIWDENPFEVRGNGKIDIAYSDIRGGWAGVGNIDADPCFAKPGYWDPNGTPEDPNDDFWVAGDYHLKSQAGRWNPNTQSWVKDELTSPCIDAGDPDSPIGLEPFPNGGRINMGAYGGTAEASKSYFGGPVCETIVAGDINGDCRVDFVDVAILVRHWLREY